MPPMPRSPSASAIASLCFAVFAFFDKPLPLPFLAPFAVLSPASIGVAAPEGLLLPSSKCPSPEDEISYRTGVEKDQASLPS